MKTYIKEINGISYRLALEEELYTQALILLSEIEKIGDTVRDGYKIQIGFTVFTLNKQSHNEYTIAAPDYMKNPFNDTTTDLTLAVGIQFQQLDILKTCGVVGESVRFDDKIAVADNALNKEYISMQRFSDLGESGWCIEGLEKDKNGSFNCVSASEYKPYYAYQLLSIRPSLVWCLLLPYGYMVVFSGENILEILNENNESLLNGI